MGGIVWGGLGWGGGVQGCDVHMGVGLGAHVVGVGVGRVGLRMWVWRGDAWRVGIGVCVCASVGMHACVHACVLACLRACVPACDACLPGQGQATPAAQLVHEEWGHHE